MSSRGAQAPRLPDGRLLGFAEYGKPNGKPLLYFHGFPASRLEAAGLHRMASSHGIRLLALDRPGFGLSTHDPRRRFTDWPVDVEAFAKQVGLSRFAILGVSGGGPYALACANELPPELMTAVGVLAGAGVWDKGFWTEDVPWFARLLYLAGNYWPSGTRAVSYALVEAVRWILSTKPAERRIDRWIEGLEKAEAANEKKAGGDAEIGTVHLTAITDVDEEDTQQEPWGSRERRRERLMGILFEGFAQGTAGFVHETQLLTGDWGFRFEEIRYDKVQMWHGSRDVNAPVGSIRDMAKRMPHCSLTESDDNHFSMGRHFEDVFVTLTSHSDAGEAHTTATSEAGGVSGLRERLKVHP